MHVNSITKRERDGYYLYSDGGIKLGGPFASSYEADSLGEYLSSTLGEAPVEEYQRMGSQHGYVEPRTTTIEGTPNPWGDLPTEREQADFRRKTRGIPSGGFDWRNIIPNTLSDIRSGYEGLQGLFEREEDSLLDYNPEAELQEALQRTELEEQYLRDPTRYRGPEPPEDRGWTSRFGDVLGSGLLSMVSEAEANQHTIGSREVYDYLESKKIPRKHIMGILANIQGESSFQPWIGGDAGTSGGLFQHHDTRFDDMKKAVGKNWRDDWKGQIDFALSEPHSTRYLKKEFATAEDASEWFTRNWEIPADVDLRTEERKKFLQMFENY